MTYITSNRRCIVHDDLLLHRLVCPGVLAARWGAEAGVAAENKMVKRLVGTRRETLLLCLDWQTWGIHQSMLAPFMSPP